MNRPPYRPQPTQDGRQWMQQRRAAEAERQRRLAEEKKARRAAALRLFLNRFLLYLAFLAVILVLCGGLFLFSLHRVERVRTPSTYTYILGEENKEEGKKPLRLTLTAAEAVREGTLYLPMSALSDLLALTVTGTPDVQKFITSTGEYVRFTVGSVTASVNGELLLLDGPAWLRKSDGKESLWIPASFADWMLGVSVTVDEAAGSMTLLPTADAVGFRMKGGAPLAVIDEGEEFGNTPAVAFTADLSAYEEYMNPADRDAYLTLVNVDHKLAADYIPPDLVNVTNTRKDGRATQQLRECAAKALEAFFLEMRACGITDVSVTSAYRSYNYQQQLFEQRVAMYPSLTRAEAEANAATVVNYPGASEHQSGLCVDMHNLSAADVSFAGTAAFKWMRENAHKFGFILRYPEDKVNVTGISYEPWHYRFVGRYHATRIYESGLCLEEYVAQQTGIPG